MASVRQSRSNSPKFVASGIIANESIKAGIPGAIIARATAYSGCGQRYNRTHRLREVTVQTQFWLFTAVLLVGLLSPRALVAQISSQFPQTNPNTSSQGPQDEELKKWKKDAVKKANQKRQAEIQKDTEKLLKLATELQDYVGKTDENVLSLNVVKKAEEIEKLAHSVKEKMKVSY